MSDGETKKRTSVRVSTDTLERLEQYQEENGLDNRSEAFESIVANWAQTADSKTFWGAVAQQSLYAVTFAFIIALMTASVALYALFVAAYPSPWAVVGLGAFFGSLVVISGGSLSYRYSVSKMKRLQSEVKA